MKVLVIDDSAVFRMAISASLKASAEIGEVKTARNGEEGIDILKKDDSIELITLDLEMPVMDGITAIQEIRKFNQKVIIIVFSSLSREGAEKTLEALRLGANDFVTKQEVGGAYSVENSLEMISEVLIPKVKSFNKKGSTKEGANSNFEEGYNKLVGELAVRPRLLVIGSSTGGPEALGSLFSKITKKPNMPILLVQHMPAYFTERFAAHLDKLCPHISFKEAKSGDIPKAGDCLIAPGDYHMVFEADGKVSLNQDEKVCFVRPAVDVLFDSVTENFEKGVMAIVLTGMGSDGALSCKRMSAKKSPLLLVQDEESSVVWGMPGAVKEQLPDVVELNIEYIAKLINESFSRI